MITQYKAIALAFGYVESNTTAWLIYRAEYKTPTSRKEALYSFVEYLWSKFSGENDDHAESRLYKKERCCIDFWYKNKYPTAENKDTFQKPTVCGTCGKEYDFTWKFSDDKWEDFLRGIMSSDADSYGDHDEAENPYGWSPWMYRFDVPQHEMVIVGENAEVILSQVLFELHPELREEDSEVPHPDDEGFDFYHRDYINLMDEECVLSPHGHGYVTPKEAYWEGRPKQTITWEFPNGASSTMVNGFYTHIKYNTGDQVWIKFVNKKYEVYKVQTHDGLVFEYPIETES